MAQSGDIKDGCVFVGLSRLSQGLDIYFTLADIVRCRSLPPVLRNVLLSSFPFPSPADNQQYVIAFTLPFKYVLINNRHVLEYNICRSKWFRRG